MPSVARSLVFAALIVPLAALAACSGNNDAPADPGADASITDAKTDAPRDSGGASRDSGAASTDAGASCKYRDFRGNEVVCTGDTTPDGGNCPSVDGCNGTSCLDGKLLTTQMMCACWFPGVTFGGQDYLMYGTMTADDGCTVCTCGNDTGGPYLEEGGTCDSSACK